jgi:hypothetical protein
MNRGYGNSYALAAGGPMNADDMVELDEHLKSARLAAKWVVDHAERAHEYDRAYAALALQHIEDALELLLEYESL